MHRRWLIFLSLFPVVLFPGRCTAHCILACTVECSKCSIYFWGCVCLLSFIIFFLLNLFIQRYLFSAGRMFGRTMVFTLVRLCRGKCEDYKAGKHTKQSATRRMWERQCWFLWIYKSKQIFMRKSWVESSFMMTFFRGNQEIGWFLMVQNMNISGICNTAGILALL